MFFRNQYLICRKNSQYIMIYSLLVTVLLFLTVISASNKIARLQIENSKTDRKLVGVQEIAFKYETMYNELLQTKTRKPEEIIVSVFGKDAPIMLKVASCESSMGLKKVNKQSSARGLFMIMSSAHGIAPKWLMNDEINTLVAKQLYDDQGLVPWYSSRNCWR